MARSSGLLPVLLSLGVVLAGCGQQTEERVDSSPPATSSGPSASSTQTAPAAAAGSSPATTEPAGTAPAPTATVTGAKAGPDAWATFTTADGQLAFDLPATWTVTDPAGELPEGGGAFAEVRNEAGKPLATLRTNMATGSTCTEKYPFEVLDLQELPALAVNGSTPRFLFETRGNQGTPGPANTPAAAYGIMTAPTPEGGLACPIFQFFTWPPTAAMFGAFYNPENNVTPGSGSLPYLEQARLYLDTAEYGNIKRMITSLRPAG